MKEILQCQVLSSFSIFWRQLTLPRAEGFEGNIIKYALVRAEIYRVRDLKAAQIHEIFIRFIDLTEIPLVLLFDFL